MRTIQRAWNWLRGEQPAPKEFKPNLPPGQVYLGGRFVFDTTSPVRGVQSGRTQASKAASRMLDTMVRNQ